MKESIVIRIGLRSEQLDHLLTLNDCSCWAFITAWNPIGKPDHDLEENIRRNKSLLALLQQMDWWVLPGWGIPDIPEWPPEASFLILGLSKPDAIAISKKFGQRAFVYGEFEKKSELCVLDGQKHDDFYATTYTTAPLNLHHGQGLQHWLNCLKARRIRFSTSAEVNCVFKQPYQNGYLCWLST